MPRAILCILAVLLAACPDGTGPLPPDPLPPGPPAQISILAGDGQEGRVATTLPVPFVVEVTDSGGRPVPRVELRWRVPTEPRGGQPLERVTVTDSDGRSTNGWELGHYAGEFVMEVSWYEAGARAPIEDSAHALVLPGPVTEWAIEGDTIVGLQPGDSLRMVAIGWDEYHNRSTDGDPPSWSVDPDGVVSVSEENFVRAVAPGSAVITGSTTVGSALRVLIGVNATTGELIRVPPGSDYWESVLSSIDGSGLEILVVGGVRQRDEGNAATPHLWRLEGSAAVEVPAGLTSRIPGSAEAVAVEDHGRSWLASPWHSTLLLSTGGSWQSVYAPTDNFPHARWHVAVRRSGGIWLTHQRGWPSGPILLHHDGTTATRHELAADLETVLPAADGAGNTYLAGQADGSAYLAQWDGGSVQRLAVPGHADDIGFIRGARGSGLTWAVSRTFRDTGPGEFTTDYQLLRIASSEVEMIPDPLGPGRSRALGVRRDGVPYLAGNRRVAWLEGGSWHVHWLEEASWEVGRDLYVDDSGVVYLLVEKVGVNPTWPSPPSHPLESGVLVIRP